MSHQPQDILKSRKSHAIVKDLMNGMLGDSPDSDSPRATEVQQDLGVPIDFEALRK